MLNCILCSRITLSHEGIFLIISRYLFKEVLSILFALTVLLILIYISHRFMFYLVQAATGSIPAEFILQLLGVKLLSDVMLILPLSFFLAILLALGRLYKDNEITAMAACGIAIPFSSLLMLGFLFALFVGFLSLFLAPWAEEQEDNLKQQAHSLAEVRAIAAGRFKSFYQNKGIFYVEDIDPDNGLMRSIFLQMQLPEKNIVMTADSGYQVRRGGHLYMVLVDGFRYENRWNSLQYTITKFTEHSVKIPQILGDNYHKENRAATPTGLLIGSNLVQDQAQLQWRISLPLSVLLLTALAVPLSRTTPRQGQYAKIFVGILVYLIYNNLLNLSQKWVAREEINVWIGVWWVHGVLLLIILVLWYLPYFRTGRYLQDWGDVMFDYLDERIEILREKTQTVVQKVKIGKKTVAFAKQRMQVGKKSIAIPKGRIEK